MNFFTFPFTVQREILQQLSVDEIFVFSVCSQKTHRLICASNLRVGNLHYVLHGEKLEIWTRAADASYSRMAVLGMNTDFEGNTPMEVTIGGVQLKCRWDLLQFQYLNTLQSTMPLAIHKHVYSMFSKSSSTFELKVCVINNDLHQFPVFPEATDICIDTRRTEAAKIEEFFAKFPRQRSAVIRPLVTRMFSPNSKVFQLESVYFRTALDLTSHIIEHFNGRFLRIGSGDCHARHLIKFLTDWMRGEKYQNLDALWIEFVIQNITPQIILDALKTSTRKWDRTRRPENFEYIVKLNGYFSNRPTVLNCSNYLDIERQTDGMLASFQITNIFTFCVWNQSSRKP